MGCTLYLLDNQSNISAFNLRDEAGYSYLYENPEQSFYTSGPGQTSILFNSTWQLASIQGLNSREKVTFRYRTESFSHNLDDFAQQISLNEKSSGGETILSPPNPGAASMRNYNNVRFPTEIIFPTGKIMFVSDQNRRTDIPYTSYALDSIVVYGYDVALSTYKLLRTYDLKHSYLANNENNGTRLFLEAVVMKDSAGKEIGRYSCSYNTNAKLPYYTSFSKD
jgi:hypothetical protein